MTRRLTAAILGTVAVTVLVVASGTVVLSVVANRERAERDLRDQVVAVSDALAAVARSLPDAGELPQRGVFARLAAALQVSGIDVAVFDGRGRLLPNTGRLPDGLSVDDLDVTELLAGRPVSGRDRSTVFAAAPFPRVGDLTVVVAATRDAGLGLGPSAPWLLVSSLGAIVVAAVVARSLGRRLAGPVRAAEAATGRIAAGDLSTRLPDPPPGAHDPLDDLARSINALAADLQRSRGLEQQFLLSVSHDLRTPLTSIRGFAEAIADGAAPDPTLAAGVILTESQRLERLVGDLLDLARLDAHRFSLAPVRLDGAAVVADVVEAFAPEIDGAGLRVDRRLPDGPAVAVADRDRLAQVVANLVENAVKFAAAAITVEVRQIGEHTEVVVGDDGPGIAPDDLGHVFERLYVARAQPRRKESGSGLGLAIAHELVVAMGGEIDVRSTPGAGARFTVRLPAAG